MKGFVAWRQRWYRWFLGGRTISGGSFRIRGVARGWLIYSLAGSALALSWVDATWGAATFLLSLMGGVVSDRIDRRRLLVLAQALCGVMPSAIAMLVLGEVIQVWHLALANFLMGAVFSFVIPARRALLTDLMPPEALMNAVALSSMAMALMRIFCSGVGGVVVDRLGPTAAYVLIALAVEATAWMYRKLPSPEREEAKVTSIRSDLVDGGRYILDQPVLLGVLALELGRVMLYRPYIVLLPIFAGDVFDVGAMGLGLLQGASAVGRLVGSSVIASLGDTPYKTWLLLGAGGVSGVGLVLLGSAPSFWVALLSLVVATAGGGAYRIARNTLLQSVCDRQMRGRVVGFRRLVWGLRPLGTLPAGALADSVGAPLTVILEGAGVLALFTVGACSGLGCASDSGNTEV